MDENNGGVCRESQSDAITTKKKEKIKVCSEFLDTLMGLGNFIECFR